MYTVYCTDMSILCIIMYNNQNESVFTLLIVMCCSVVSIDTSNRYWYIQNTN